MFKNGLIILLSLALGLGGVRALHTIEALNQAMLVMQLKHQKALVRTKIRERGKRLLATLPVAGTVAAVWFEQREYEEWKQEHPEGTPTEYAQEIKQQTLATSRELYRELQSEYPWLEGSPESDKS